MNICWERRAFPLRALAAAADHDHRTSDVVLRVETALRSQAVDLTRHTKRLLEKLRFGVNIRHNQIGSDRAKSLAHTTCFFRSFLRCGTHLCLLFKFLSQARLEFVARQTAQVNCDAD